MGLSKIIEHLRKGGYEAHADIIEARAERSVGFNMIPTNESDLSLGCSKAGGLPDLPPGCSWPHYRGKPLSFVLQINLEDTSRFHHCEDLPNKGLLSFFYNYVYQPWGFDPIDRRQWKVLYTQEPERGLKRLAVSEEDAMWAFNPCALEFHEAPCARWVTVPVEALNLEKREINKYLRFLLSLPADSSHQILGHTVGIQSTGEEMQRRCEWVSNGLFCGAGGGRAFDQRRAQQLEPGADEWRLLLQLDSDENTRMEWGDRRQLYFWIRDEDLRQKDFTDVWVILQCL